MIAHYVLDDNRPLTSESSGNTTYYLYGLGAIGEKTTDWAYSLPDGVNTPRQLTNPTGDITHSARYTPWGDALETYGTGNFAFGYFGGVMDAATGLLYVGNGQYYDPVTGRFLTRDASPNNTNPYVPWNPLGALIGPLGLLALVFGRRKKGSKVGMLLVLLLVGVSVGMTLAGCEQPKTPTPPAPNPTATPDDNDQPATPIKTPTQIGPGRDGGSGPSTPEGPAKSPNYDYCGECEETGFDAISVLNWADAHKDYTDGNGIFIKGSGYDPSLISDCSNFVANSLKQSEPFASDVDFAGGSWKFINIKPQLEYLQGKGFYTITWNNPHKEQPLYNNADFLSWLNLHRNDILRASVVYYSVFNVYQHAAIVDDWKKDPARGIELPTILEHSGPDDFPQPRFIDQSMTTDIDAVTIVNPHWSKKAP